MNTPRACMASNGSGATGGSRKSLESLVKENQLLQEAVSPKKANGSSGLVTQSGRVRSIVINWLILCSYSSALPSDSTDPSNPKPLKPEAGLEIKYQSSFS